MTYAIHYGAYYTLLKYSALVNMCVCLCAGEYEPLAYHNIIMYCALYIV